MEPVALGLGIYGAVNASITLLEKTWNWLVDLRGRWKDAKNVPVKLHKLVKLSLQIKKVVESIEPKLNSFPEIVLETLASGIIGVLHDKLYQNVNEAAAVLENLKQYQDSPAGPSSASSKIRKHVGMSVKMKSIAGALSKVESCLGEAIDAASSMEVHLELKATSAPISKEERFVPHFDCPELPDNVVLDFRSADTQEGLLLRKLLKLREKESVYGISAVGRSRGSATHGMGGVGKTTALRAICYEKEVKEVFSDGICFLEFGQDAKDADVQDQVERCIFNLGGKTTAAEMRKQSSLEGALYQAARWLRGKTILFVCDDLWRSPICDFGYLPLLKRLLKDAPLSKLLVSTRDQRIAEEVSMNYETFGTLAPQGPRARNLLSEIAFGGEHIEILRRTDIQLDVETILDVCAGLQLALCMAGRALRIAIGELDDIQKAFEVYASQIKCDQRPDETDRTAQLYDHKLSYIVDASLVQCEQWAAKSLKSVNVQELFRSLCVLEKQMVMPKSMLSILWGLGSRETDQVVRRLSDLGLVTKTKYETHAAPSQNDVREDYGVRLHDLVLVLCQEMVGDKLEEQHKRVIDALRRSKSVWTGEEIPTLEEWWRLKKSGYVYGNLSRHMERSGQQQTLANLLADVRWTLRRVKVGGWAMMKMDYELLLANSDCAEFAGIRKIYEVLKKCWSGISIEERSLSYYLGASLSREERENRFTGRYIDSMIHYLTRPFLLPRTRFLGSTDNRELSVMRCSNSRGTYVDFSRSTDLAVVGTEENLLVWSVSAQKELCSIHFQPKRAKSQLCCVAISANGRLIVSGYTDGTFQRWDTKNGEEIGAQVKAHESFVLCLAISKDSSTIVTGSKDMSLRLWNAETGEPKGATMNHREAVTCVAICEKRSIIVSGSLDRTICRWNIESNAMIGKPMRGHKSEIRCVSVDEDEKIIVSGSDDKTLLRWDAGTGKQIGGPMHGHSGYVLCVAISRCGRKIVSGSLDRTLRMWDSVNGNAMGEPFLGHFSYVQSVQFTGEDEIIASGTRDGTIHLWGTVPSTLISESTLRSEGAVTNIVFSDDGEKVVTSDTTGTLLQWNVKNGKLIEKPMKSKFGKVFSIGINGNCGMIMAVYKALRRSEIIRWDTSKCEMIGQTIVHKQDSVVTCAALSSNGKVMVTGSRDGTVQRYCAISGNALGESMRGHTNTVRCIAFGADDEMIATASSDKSIICWSTVDGKQIGNPITLNDRIEDIDINGDGTVIVSLTRRRLSLWDTTTGESIGEFVSRIRIGDSILANNDCTKIVTWTDMGGLIRWLNVAPGGMILETSHVHMSADVAKFTIDKNHAIAALGLENGAVAVCDIHE